MGKQQISDEQWEEARALWEGDTKITYTIIAAALGISKQRVAKKATDDKWTRNMNHAKVLDQAHRVADRASVGVTLPEASFPLDRQELTTLVDPDPGKKVEAVEAEPVDTQHLTPAERAEHAAAERRAQILVRHRREAEALRTNLYQSIKGKDFVLGKCAKINAEAMQIVHTLERKAWGMDKPEEQQQPVIIMERG
jgi:hypothetical protein